MAELILFNKPFRVLSQFTDRQGRRTLADYLDAPGFYAAGRLDYDSEGLLLLCADGALQARLSGAAAGHWKHYLLQLDGAISDDAVARLRRGVELRDGPTRPARVRRCAPPALWPRHPPVEERVARTSSWIEIAVQEGRNRQLRRMAAAVGFPVLRLVRTRVGDWSLDGLAPGEMRHLRVHLPRSAGRSGKMQTAGRRTRAGTDGSSTTRGQTGPMRDARHESQARAPDRTAPGRVKARRRRPTPKSR